MADSIPEQIVDHLDEALQIDEGAEKDFHIRQAEQLAIRLADED